MKRGRTKRDDKPKRERSWDIGEISKSIKVGMDDRKKKEKDAGTSERLERGRSERRMDRKD